MRKGLRNNTEEMNENKEGRSFKTIIIKALIIKNENSTSV